jgi:hypothetical protein
MDQALPDSAEMQRRPLVSWIERALCNLGSRAHLKDIYTEVQRLGYPRGGKDLNKLIRSEIQKHSSDSDRFTGSPNDDLFGTGKKRSGIWELREVRPNESGLREDLNTIEQQQNLDPTTKKALVDARLGQGKFRSGVLQLWDNCCSVTGSMIQVAIRASHIKPWRVSSDAERLDPNNGLPLIASLDALFDAGLISFDSFGSLIVSSKMDTTERGIFGIGKTSLRKKLTAKTAKYLAHHRAKHGFKS